MVEVADGMQLNDTTRPIRVAGHAQKLPVEHRAPLRVVTAQIQVLNLLQILRQPVPVGGKLPRLLQATVLDEFIDPFRGEVRATVDLPLLEIVLTLIVREARRGDFCGT